MALAITLFLGCSVTRDSTESERVVTTVPDRQEDVDQALRDSIDELRHAVGVWSVTTEFMNSAGEEAGEAVGEYRFDWVVEDRILSGRSEQPALGQVSAILFYVTPADRRIEMVSVGPDGKLWVMSGPLGGDTRTSRVFRADDGAEMQLRFTRSEVEPDRFLSRMDVTRDGGTTWTPGNRQVFVRQK